MKKIIIFLISFLFVFPFLAFAKDVHVKGYSRKDGTYVSPHIRSAPDSDKSNNYGPSKSSDQLLNPRQRDRDKDGIPNYLDKDDDNDGIKDNNDRKQYSPSNKNPYGK